jgi:hypothetical protein
MAIREQCTGGAPSGHHLASLIEVKSGFRKRSDRMSTSEGTDGLLTGQEWVDHQQESLGFRSRMSRSLIHDSHKEDREFFCKSTLVDYSEHCAGILRTTMS